MNDPLFLEFLQQFFPHVRSVAGPSSPGFRAICWATEEIGRALFAIHNHDEGFVRLGRALSETHQGCAMDVLARIESVNMYWYVWVCILACILVRIGMYQLGTYWCTYWQWYVLHVLVCIGTYGMYLYVFISAGIGRYWHVSVRIACIGMYGMYCMYWYVYVCICMYSMYWYVWYVLYELVCNDMYLMVYACIACIVCIVRIGMYGMYGMYLYVLYVLNVLLCSRMYLLVYKNTYQYIPIHANTKNLYNCYQWESTQRHFNFMSNALPTGQTISEIFTSLYVYVCICMYGMYWYAIHTSTCTYIPIHTRAQTYTAPYLRSARPDGPT